ncbi:MAG TPA: tRNA glutamyl-Q(34) synthetase GluQRS, partial [Steroidobacteraceae bacterium]|nr:tRNA glutamyl-Q(34) synthetase GluQRS [Steroidobacteraceae bacterium]
MTPAGAGGQRAAPGGGPTGSPRPAATQTYRGRFAPSPTGKLHLGSLFAAAGGFLRARAARGSWLVRMEDLDAPRVVPGAADDMLHTLERLGLEWDGSVLFQSTRKAAYEETLAQLSAKGLTFPCSCSRSELAASALASSEPAEELFYPGTCRGGMRSPLRPAAIRMRVPPGPISFSDALQGPYSQDVSRAIGDFVLRRRDGLFAYQLAVVVDDAFQGITEVVRGSDLLGNTPRQLLLQRALGLPQPAYAHLPVLMETEGLKLSKSRRSLPVDPE